jgi:hypothetical protein
MRTSMRLVPACLILAAACSDVPVPTAPATGGAQLRAVNGDAYANSERYAAIGTSISMGWASNGVYDGTQQTSWVAILGERMDAPFTLPLIQAPGCTSPLVAPLGEFRRLSGESAAASTTCAANVPGVTLPAGNVGIAGATAGHALLARPELVGAAAPWYSRVLPQGQTQLTAALSQDPTFVTVELGGNEVLNGSSGLVLDGATTVSLANFIAPYTAILNALAGRKVLLVGMPADLRNVPMMRHASEIWDDREGFAALNVAVHASCETSDTWINVSLKTLGVVAAAAASPVPVPYTCHNAGGIDYVLTPADVQTLNQRMADMDAFIRAQAAARGFAYTTLGEIFDRPGIKGRYSVMNQLGSQHPYGVWVSLDGVHPSPLAHRFLARAAAKAVEDTYGVRVLPAESALIAIPTPELGATFSLERARRAAGRLIGRTLPLCPLPGQCESATP